MIDSDDDVTDRYPTHPTDILTVVTVWYVTYTLSHHSLLTTLTHSLHYTPVNNNGSDILFQGI